MLDDILKTQYSFARKAASHPEHRFDNLYFLLKRDDWQNEALAAVLSNVGARTGGVDGITRRNFEKQGFREQFLTDLKADIASGHYQPQPVRRQYIPKANGKVRPLGILTIRDRVVQMMLKMMLEPIYESDFLDCSVGFRPQRRTMDAIAVCYWLINPRNGYYWIVEGDIRSCFDKVNHNILLKLVSRRVADVKVLNLIGRFLKVDVMEGQIFRRSSEGTPQGGIIALPTMLQIGPIGAQVKRGRHDPENDVNLIFPDLNSFDERTDEFTFRRPVCFIEAIFHRGCKVPQASDDQAQFHLAGHFVRDLLRLGFEISETLSQTVDAWLEFLFLDKAFCIAVN